jgi:hypothetical protein
MWISTIKLAARDTFVVACRGKSGVRHRGAFHMAVGRRGGADYGELDRQRGPTPH